MSNHPTNFESRLALLNELAAVEPLAWIESRLMIRTKSGAIVPFLLNIEQRRLYALVRRLRRQGRPVRIIILKARQVGFSTVIEAFGFEKIYRTPHLSAFIVAHEVDAAQRIYDMSRRFYDLLPENEKHGTEYENRRELRFKEPSGSIFEVEVSKNSAGGRGATVQFVHFSESAFYGSQAHDVLAGTMSSVPKEAVSEVYNESTAFGKGNEFHKEWERAVAGDSDFIPFFCPWHSHDGNVMPVLPGFSRTEEEEELARKFKLSDEQLSWRRYTIRNDCLGDPEMFRQENPMTPHEAFRSSGRPVFDQRELDWQFRNRCVDPIAYYQAKYPAITGDGGRSVRWDDKAICLEPCRAAKSGVLRVWEHPKEGGEHHTAFLVAADVAEGLEHGDDTYITVWRRGSMDVAAEWVGKCDPDEAWLIMCAIAKMYGVPWMAPEANNHGHTVLAGLTRAMYPRIYARRQRDRVTDKIEPKLGWLTDRGSKPLMIGTLQSRIRERNISLRSAEMITQLSNYERKVDGSLGAPNGMKDDAVTSAAIAVQVDLDLPLPVVERPKLLVVENAVTGHRRAMEDSELRPGLTRAGLELDDYDRVTGYGE